MSENMPVAKNAGLARFAVRRILPYGSRSFLVADAHPSTVHPLSAEEDQVSLPSLYVLQGC